MKPNTTLKTVNTPILSEQLRMVRYGLYLSTREITEATRLSSATLAKIEAGRPVSDGTVIALVNFYKSCGAEFREDGFVRVPKTKIGEPTP